MAQPALKYYSEADYLEMERESAEKHFFYAGEIYAMAGASYEHNVIEDNMRLAIGNFLQGKNCRSFGSNLRLHVPGQSFYTYPDIMVIYDKPQFLTDTFDTVTNPSLLIEILSEGTADYDKGLKFDLYRRITILQQYLLVDSRKPHLMLYSRQPDGSWTLQEFTGMDLSVPLTAIGMMLPAADCYRGLSFPAAKA